MNTTSPKPRYNSMPSLACLLLPGFSPSKNEAPGPPSRRKVGGTPVECGGRKRANPTPMMRAVGSERFSGTYNVPNSKGIVSPLGVVSDPGSSMISPAFRSLADVLALCAKWVVFLSMLDWAMTCGKTRIRVGMRNIAAPGFIAYPFRQSSLPHEAVTNNELLRANLTLDLCRI